jgi:hypothetical protein
MRQLSLKAFREMSCFSLYSIGRAVQTFLRLRKKSICCVTSFFVIAACDRVRRIPQGLQAELQEPFAMPQEAGGL